MKEIINFNDNELIYLIKNNNEQANNLLIKKYENYIHSRIHELGLENHEDCFQEGLIVLFNAVNNFNEDYNKSFTKYFEVLLNNKLIDLKRRQIKESNYFVLMDVFELDYCNYLNEESSLIEYNNCDALIAKLSFVEKSVFYDYFLCNLSIDEIALRQKTNKKNIYYIIYRIKKKIKKYMVK